MIPIGKKSFLTLASLTIVFALTTGLQAQAQASSFVKNAEGSYDFNPYDPAAAEQLQLMDQQYEELMGISPLFAPGHIAGAILTGTCDHRNCPVFAHVDRSVQRLYLYIDGQLSGIWKTSTGMPGFPTPNMDTHPDGRIYDVYSSTTFPGFDNMPYAVFIKGGFAIHGAPGEEDNHLGHVASHGCIRIHTEYAETFNRMVRQIGVRNVWITVDAVNDVSINAEPPTALPVLPVTTQTQH